MEFFDARGFALGMVALINPCGFALLPAYLGFFLGLDDPETVGRESRLVALNRAQIVGLSMSAGFLLVFGLLGIVFASAFSSIAPVLPWVTFIIGIGLLQLGIAMLFGFQPLLALPKLQKGGQTRSFMSMFLFGVSYALASLTCTIGLFLSVVGTSSSGTSFGERFGGFLSYGLGMGLLATVLTLAVALGKRSIVGRFRQLLPRINQISAIVLVVVGTYVVIYGVFSIYAFISPVDIPGWVKSTVDTAEGWQASMSEWVNGQATWFGWTFAAINLALAIAGFAAKRAAGARAGSTATA